MNRQSKLGGTFTLPGTSFNLYRMGYGAMQLAGPGVWGLPPNIDEAVAVLRDAVAAGVNHIDTSDFYGPSVTNQLIKQVLYRCVRRSRNSLIEFAVGNSDAVLERSI
jgi:pyridoxine 4-dehydrogenase